MANITLPLDIDSLEILSQDIVQKGNIVLTVESKCQQTNGHKCGKPATKRHGYGETMKVRHTSILDTPVILKIKPARYLCGYCDDAHTTLEKFDWVAKGGIITKGLLVLTKLATERASRTLSR